MNLYIIGPVTGKENDNLEEFERARERLLESGHCRVDIPHDYIAAGSEWRWAMCGSVQYITDQWAMHGDDFGIAVLDGLKDSRGAVIEYTLAQQLGIPCKPWREWLE